MSVPGKDYSDQIFSIVLMKPILDSPHDDHLGRSWDKTDYCIFNITFSSNMLKILWSKKKKKKREALSSTLSRVFDHHTSPMVHKMHGLSRYTSYTL